jgi:hypothetical protein
MTQGAPHAAAQGMGEVVNHVGHFPRVHHVSRKNKKRNRYDNVVGIVGIYYLICHQAQIAAFYQKIGCRSGDHAQGNGHSQYEYQNKYNEAYD